MDTLREAGCPFCFQKGDSGMKQYLKRIVLVTSLMAAITGCAGTAPEAVKPFLGEWNCQENASGSDEIYTGYMELDVHKDGSFSIFDAEAGNPGITGKLEIDSEDQLTLYCDDNADFDPPATWETMDKIQKIQYAFSDADTLQLTYGKGKEKSTLIFEREK